MPHTTPTLKGMKVLFRAGVVCILAWYGLSLAWPAYSETGSQDAKSGTYQSGEINPFGAPAGLINLGINTGYVRFQDPTAPTDEKIINTYQGCGGVSQADYTSGLYYMPEVFGKFQQDVNSPLAKQLLTYNYSMPQTAALFDTLNNYGNARYQQFVQGCKVTPFQQDAKQKFLNQCVPPLVAKRAEAIKAATQSSTDDKYKEEPLLSQLAYAQAWEVCSAQYSSNTTIKEIDTLALFKSSNKDFIATTVSMQNVNNAISNTLCIDEQGKPLGKKCWQSALLPKVNLCLDPALTDPTTGCGNNGQYGVKEAPIGVGLYFDLLRYAISEGMVKKMVMPLLESIRDTGIAKAGERSAAKQAIAQFTDSIGTETSNIDSSIKAFQINYLNCQSSNVNTMMTFYSTAIKNESGTDKSVTVNEVTLEDYQSYIKKMQLVDTDSEQDASLAYAIQAAAGCSVLHHIPMLDPNLMAAMNTECDARDIHAFYTMASYDAALQATRDSYQYLLLRLKQIYGQILTGGIVPGTVSTTSPAIQGKIADAIKEVMIPAVETQLTRLEQINQNRGQFAQRVQSIYANKRGCVNMIGVDAGGMPAGTY